MDCQLATADNVTFVCTACGRKHTLKPHERIPLHLQCGLTVHEAGSPRPPPMPSMPLRAWSLAKALANFVADGCKTVDAEEYSRRLGICDGCDTRRGNWCSHAGCGCFLPAKAKGRAWKCPDGKWTTVTP
jgi:hypothetical protein